MVEREPVTTLSGFSSDDAVPTEWARGRKDLQDAELYWLSTVRPDGRPHVTPLLGIWLDGALYFCTGANERKAKNLSRNAHCILTTGCNRLDGLDIVVEGDAAKVTDETELRLIADTYESKYGAHFTEPEGTWSVSVTPSEMLKHSRSGSPLRRPLASGREDDSARLDGLSRENLSGSRPSATVISS